LSFEFEVNVSLGDSSHFSLLRSAFCRSEVSELALQSHLPSAFCRPEGFGFVLRSNLPFAVCVLTFAFSLLPFLFCKKKALHA
jgi:hypothetical protein